MSRYVLVAFLLAGGPVLAASLAVTDLTVRRSEEGAPLDRPVFRAGEMVYMNFRVTGFNVSGDDQDVALIYNIDTVDPSGRKVAETKTGAVTVQLAPEDKNWTPKIRYEVLLPPVPEPGTYTTTITVDDQLGKTRATATRTFEVNAPKLPDSSKFGISNFRLQRAEDANSGIPESEPVHPGETVWARFDVSGYRFGPGNKYEVRFSLALKNAAAKVMLEQKDAAVDAGEGFYPKHFVTGLFSFSLDRTLAPGIYALVIGITDPIGNQSAESSFPFTVAK